MFWTFCRSYFPICASNIYKLEDEYYAAKYEFDGQNFANYYGITHILVCQYIDYDNGLVLNPASSHNTFGISAGGVNHGYVGFLKDVILDTNYQVK